MINIIRECINAKLDIVDFIIRVAPYVLELGNLKLKAVWEN